MCYPASSICGWDEVQHLWEVHHRMLLNNREIVARAVLHIKYRPICLKSHENSEI